jgi:hypothetical protein
MTSRKPLATKLPLVGFRSLFKGWLKFAIIQRTGKVGELVSNANDHVQEMRLEFETDIWKHVDSEARMELMNICTDGAPSCTINFQSNGGAQSGPMLQLQVVVQIPDKSQYTETRTICFSKGVALLEKPLPVGANVAPSSRFLACIRRYVRFRDVAALAAPATEHYDTTPLPKASSFRWRGRASVCEALEVTMPGSAPSASTDVPATFKWCRRGTIPVLADSQTSEDARTTLESARVVKKRGREEYEGESHMSHEATPEENVRMGVQAVAKRIKIGRIIVK